MTVKLTTEATEGSTYDVDVTFPAGVTRAKWSLSLGNGTAVNNRTGVAIPTPTTSETITLTGDDLSLDDETTEFYLITDALYGADLHYRECYEFKIVSLPTEPLDLTITQIFDDDVIDDATVITDDVIMGG